MLPAKVAFKIHYVHLFAGDQNKFYPQKVRTILRRHATSRNRLLFAVFCLLLLGDSTAFAQKDPGFRAISWSPSNLESGSPILFTVELDQPAATLRGTWLNHTLVFTKAHQGNTWYVLAGIDVEQAPGTYPLELTTTATTPRHALRQVVVHPGRYQTTTLQVEQKYVQPDAQTLQRIAADKVVKDAAFARQISQPLWRGSFRSPVPFAPTASFGSRRMFNGTLASIHRGTDFHAPSGTPVLAANDGEVVIAQNMFYEGNLVDIDHGQQFTTSYMHLSRIDVHVGERVHKGQRLGLSGATGRATGPHLHLGARWQGMYVDPAILLKLPLPTP